MLVYYFVSLPPPLIKLFEVDKTPWEQPVRHVGLIRKDKLIISKARNIKTNEVLSSMYAKSSSVIFLHIAKQEATTELILQSLTITLKNYKPLVKEEWVFVVETLTFAKHYDYSATLDCEDKSVFAGHDYPDDPQIRDNFTAPIHVKLDVLTPGIYTFTCMVKAKSHKQTEEKETEDIRIVVLEERRPPPIPGFQPKKD